MATDLAIGALLITARGVVEQIPIVSWIVDTIRP